MSKFTHLYEALQSKENFVLENQEIWNEFVHKYKYLCNPVEATPSPQHVFDHATIAINDDAVLRRHLLVKIASTTNHSIPGGNMRHKAPHEFETSFFHFHYGSRRDSR